MIKPNKHMDLNYSLIKMSSDILKIFQKGEIFSYDELLDKLVSLHGENAKYKFIQSLNLLYLFGKLEYYPEKDVFELNKIMEIKR